MNLPAATPTPAALMAIKKEQAQALCADIMPAWAAEVGVSCDLRDPMRQIVARVSSWVGPTSVITGVEDIVISHHEAELRQVSREKITQLGERLARAFSQADLLVASLRRSGLGV